MNRKKVAVIGSGISGIVSAYLLQRSYDVTLIEAEKQLGGHTYSVPVNDSSLGTINIDMGFIVFNLLNYPLFTKFLNQLNVDYQDSDMSFGFYNASNNFYYNSDFPNGTFAKRRHTLSIKFWKFLYEINAFNKTVLSDLNEYDWQQLTLSEYLEKKSFGSLLINAYVLPMGAAIWSCPKHEILNFPAKSFFNFWKNHQLLTLGKRPVWKTVKGGSQSYITAFEKQFSGTIMTDHKVKQLVRSGEQVNIYMDNGNLHCVDYAVIATHADQALGMIDEPDSIESDLLGAWSYSLNSVYLHTDKRVMPPKKIAWASWLVQQSITQSDTLQMSYYMNRLQSIRSNCDYFVSLNNDELIRDEKKLHTVKFTHPIYNFKSVNTQEHLNKLNKGPLFFCGSYFGNGFHEDGVRSAVNACSQLGVSL